jgi:hypothetical protein
MRNIELTDLERQKLMELGRVRPPPQSAWRPIETAPKDGLKDILVWQKGFIGMAVWQPIYDRGFGWVTNTGFQVEPTHWQPLPEPPTGE